MNLVTGWCSKHFNYFDKLIYARFTGEKRLTEQKLRDNTADGPDVNCGRILSCSKYQFRCTVIP